MLNDGERTPTKPNFLPGSEPTTLSYTDSTVNFYNATGSLARFEKKNYLLLLKTH
jgi:hypothetical protein